MSIRYCVLVVGEEGIEPSIREEHDFESCAYTSSATRPKCLATLRY
jgi:hypothetical protein